MGGISQVSESSIRMGVPTVFALNANLMVVIILTRGGKEIKLHEVQSRKKRKNLQLNFAKHYHVFHGWTKRQVTPFLLSSPTKKKKKKCLTIYQGIWLPFFFVANNLY